MVHVVGVPAGLRVLLIRKDSKLQWKKCHNEAGLRVLLIRKDSKRNNPYDLVRVGLRVLLIRKDSKPVRCLLPEYCV